MRGALRRALRLTPALALAAAIAGCGGGHSVTPGSATVVMSTPPDYLDPQLGYTTEAAEADWIAYTPLLTYRHGGLPGGAELIPGLAARLPQISPNGKRYELTLRKNLVYSNGRPVRASDFEYTIERAIRLRWGGRRFLTRHIVGAREFEQRRARSIAGITADDDTGTITIQLRVPFGPFANVLALPATGLVPRGTPMRDLSRHPPPGVGAYRIEDVEPNRGWTMAKNPSFARLDIPDVPLGTFERVRVRIQPNATAAADDVLRGRADGFDPGTPLPRAVLARLQAGQSGRPDTVTIPSTLYFFMNATRPPFSSELARRAVVTALDRPQLARLGGNLIDPSCYLIPDGIPGHPSGSCPYGDADGHGDLAAARALVEQSGTAGQAVTVWGEDRSPQRAYVRYYAKVLGRLGYQVRLRIVQPASYFARMGSARTDPQTGFASWYNDFPNPADFYTVVDARGIAPAHSPNLGRTDDLFVQQQLQSLNLVPAQEVPSAAGQWRELDEYTARKAYLAVFGVQQVPRLMSRRMDSDGAVIHPLFLSDWSTWSLR